MPQETKDPFAVADFYERPQPVAMDLYQQDFALDLYDPPLPFPIRRRRMESDLRLKEAILLFHLAWRVELRCFTTAVRRFTL